MYDVITTTYYCCILFKQNICIRNTVRLIKADVVFNETSLLIYFSSIRSEKNLIWYIPVKLVVRHYTYDGCSMFVEV